MIIAPPQHVRALLKKYYPFVELPVYVTHPLGIEIGTEVCLLPLAPSKKGDTVIKEGYTVIVVPRFRWKESGFCDLYEVEMEASDTIGTTQQITEILKNKDLNILSLQNISWEPGVSTLWHIVFELSNKKTLSTSEIEALEKALEDELSPSTSEIEPLEKALGDELSTKKNKRVKVNPYKSIGEAITNPDIIIRENVEKTTLQGREDSLYRTLEIKELAKKLKKEFGNQMPKKVLVAGDTNRGVIFLTFIPPEKILIQLDFPHIDEPGAISQIAGFVNDKLKGDIKYVENIYLHHHDQNNMLKMHVQMHEPKIPKNFCFIVSHLFHQILYHKQEFIEKLKEEEIKEEIEKVFSSSEKSSENLKTEEQVNNVSYEDLQKVLDRTQPPKVIQKSFQEKFKAGTRRIVSDYFLLILFLLGIFALVFAGIDIYMNPEEDLFFFFIKKSLMYGSMFIGIFSATWVVTRDFNEIKWMGTKED